MDIIKFAKDSGFDVDEGDFPFKYTEDKFIGTERVLEAFAALVRAETKEECAKKVEQFRTKMDAGIEHIAEAIRSL